MTIRSSGQRGDAVGRPPRSVPDALFEIVDDACAFGRRVAAVGLRRVARHHLIRIGDEAVERPWRQLFAVSPEAVPIRA